jgi:threonine dehydrogenase-like Zn-dependent dehydrogenase
VLYPDCSVAALAEFPWQAELARGFGADPVLWVGEDLYARVAELTAARLYPGRRGNQMLLGGFDLAFDVVGTARTLNDALRWTRAGGAVVLVGASLRRLELDVTPVWYQEVDLIGSVGHDVLQWQGEAVSGFALAMRWMQEGFLRTGGLLTHRFPLAEYRRAFQAAVDKRDERSIKVAFDLL